jgi:hypothetical protein
MQTLTVKVRNNIVASALYTLLSGMNYVEVETDQTFSPSHQKTKEEIRNEVMKYCGKWQGDEDKSAEQLINEVRSSRINSTRMVDFDN